MPLCKQRVTSYETEKIISSARQIMLKDKLIKLIEMFEDLDKMMFEILDESFVSYDAFTSVEDNYDKSKMVAALTRELAARERLQWLLWNTSRKRTVSIKETVEDDSETKRWMFFAEDIDGEEMYLSDVEFIGPYCEACSMANALADTWEQKTGGLVLRLVLKSRPTGE